MRLILNSLLQFAGISMVILAFAHLGFSKLLNWRGDLQNITLINRQIFIVHTVFLAIGILMLGTVCIFFAQTLTDRSQLAIVATASFAMCWFSRLVCQLFIFTGPISDNKKVEGVLRICGTLLWIFYTGVFATTFLYQIGVGGFKD
jgi:hypothetical protein